MATTSGNYLDTGMSASWTEDLTVREAINGDKCVIGSVTGLTLSPAATGSGSTFRNGAWLNATSATEHPLDGRGSTYNASLAFTGTTAAPGDSILFCDSATDITATSGYDTEGRSAIDYAMVLTFLASEPASAFFRPAYAGTTKVTHLVNEIDEALLPSQAKASVTAAPANLTALTDRFKRVQVDHIYNSQQQQVHPKFHMASYGGDIARDIGDALTALTLDYPIADKRPLMYAMIQYGIDIYYAMLHGNTIWPASGGHNLGRKAVVTFTAIMLQNAAMKAQIKEWSQP